MSVFETKVKWFNDSKGYGFLEGIPETGGNPIFVHYTAILGDGFKCLAEGQDVRFDLVEHKKGPVALNVVKS